VKRGDYDPSGCELLVDEAPHETLSVGIEIRRGLIEHPERRGEQDDSGEPYASFLARRKSPHRLLAPSSPADTLERRRDIRGLHGMADANPVLQILACREIRLERRLMAQVNQLRVKIWQVLINVATGPKHAAALQVYESAEAAQQARLAAAVRAGDLEHLTGADCEVNRRKDVSVCAPKMQALGLDASAQSEVPRVAILQGVSQIQRLSAIG
jgi:hypothetical protein